MAMRFALALWTLAFLPGCGYLMHLGRGQLAILLQQRKLSEAASDVRLRAEERERLAWVPIIKEFGTHSLGLAGTGAYQTYVKLDRDWATLVLSACPPDALEPYQWSFPIVGRVPYKGFFDEARARQERDHFAQLGFDVHLRPASAFSTLGWFDDPILSPMLRLDEADLAETILHEMAHATVYFKNNTEFNETAATFIGQQGALEYLAFRYGENSTERRRAEEDIEDAQRFAAFIRETLAGLRSLYALPVTREEKLLKKAAYLKQARARFVNEVMPAMHHGERYRGFANEPWNNASLLARDAYYGDLKLFAKLYRARQEPLREFIDYLATWNATEARARLLREAGETTARQSAP